MFFLRPFTSADTTPKKEKKKDGLSYKTSFYFLYDLSFSFTVMASTLIFLVSLIFLQLCSTHRIEIITTSRPDGKFAGRYDLSSLAFCSFATPMVQKVFNMPLLVLRSLFLKVLIYSDFPLVSYFKVEGKGHAKIETHASPSQKMFDALDICLKC